MQFLFDQRKSSHRLLDRYLFTISSLIKLERIHTFHSIYEDNSSTDIEGDCASDITAVSHKNVREKHSYTPGPGCIKLLTRI